MKTCVKPEQWGTIICYPSKPESKQKWKGFAAGGSRGCQPSSLPALGRVAPPATGCVPHLWDRCGTKD